MKSTRLLSAPPLFIINLTNLVVDLVECALVLRLTLKLIRASTSAPFTRWIYDTTDPLLWPFRGMLPSENIGGGLVIDFSTLFAIIVYLLFGYLITELLESLMFRSEQRTDGNLK